MSRWIVVLLCFAQSLFAGWNEEFDEQSLALAEQIEEFQGQYLEQYEVFSQVREEFLLDADLKKMTFRSKEEDKFLMAKVREGWIVKKRRLQNVGECFTGELSCLLGAFGVIPPAFPMEIGGKLVVVQKMDSFTLAKKKTKMPPKLVLQSVSLEEYWKAHLVAYILGLGDLVGRNVGVTAEGEIRFFDTERCFRYQKKIERDQLRVHISFVSQSLDWPQCRMPLTERSWKEVLKFVRQLSTVREKIFTYCHYRNLPTVAEDLLYRLDKVCAFPLEKGKSFYDFYAFLEPGPLQGMDKLSAIISPILGRKAGLGSSLFFLVSTNKKHAISFEQREKIEQWIEEYIEESK